ncbi:MULTISPECIES: alpha/beta hydrolase [unclassified Nocardioides]|uniref:alpha/beta hydrolase n=1 Tax=unclassified Nocardioides TaxID=2615069 RepID=UPI000B1C7A7E|nr:MULTISPECIES: alpha/beta hydrolase [unclassified Nocardioides]
MVTGPQSPSVLYNMALAVEDHIDLIGDTLGYMAQRGHTVIEPSRQAQEQWVAETNALAEMTLLPTSATSSYIGANIPGKPRRVLVYLGAPRYRAVCDNMQQNDYRGFHFAASTSSLLAHTPSPALDPSLMSVAQSLVEQGFPGFRAAGVETARTVVESFVEMQAPAPAMAHSSDHRYGAHAEQRLRVHRPTDDTGLPVIVYLHGGGFVAGSLEVVDEVAKDLAARTGAVVVAATYRRAPEHRFPAAHDDALAALRWVHHHIAELGGDPDQIGLAGDSAGGNLAAATGLAASTAAIPLAGLALVYPLVDAVLGTPSRQEFDRGYIIELDDLAWFGEQYVASPADISDNRLALNSVPLDDLAQLPPTLIVTNELDTLRDEAEHFAARLREAGTNVTLARSPGLAHGVFWMSLAVSRCAEQQSTVASFLNDRLSAKELVSSCHRQDSTRLAEKSAGRVFLLLNY